MGAYLAHAAGHYSRDEQCPQDLLRRLHLAWGNDGWSGNTDFLALMLRLMRTTQGPVLECGSGLSSLIGTAVLPPDRPFVSLEHQSQWLDSVRRWTPRRFSARFSVQHAPLAEYGDYDWYSTKGLTLPSSFGLVICDGPPGSTRGGRYGLVPVMRSHFREGTLILLDDAHRSEDRSVAERWCVELPARVIEEHPTSLVIRVEA
jgi:hypothetical protein